MLIGRPRRVALKICHLLLIHPYAEVEAPSNDPTRPNPTQPRHTCTEQPSSPSTRTYQHQAAGDGTDPDVDAHAAAGRPGAPVVWCDGVGSSVEPGLLFDMIRYYFGATTRRTLRSPTRPNRQPFDANIHSHRSRSVTARDKMYSGVHRPPSPPIRHNQGHNKRSLSIELPRRMRGRPQRAAAVQLRPRSIDPGPDSTAVTTIGWPWTRLAAVQGRVDPPARGFGLPKSN